jgi:hypothetical protein
MFSKSYHYLTNTRSLQLGTYYQYLIQVEESLLGRVRRLLECDNKKRGRC